MRYWGHFCDNGLEIQACNLARDHSLWIFFLCRINCCLLSTNQKRLCIERDSAFERTKSPLILTRQKPPEEPGFPTAMITVQQSYMVVKSNTQTSSGKPPSSFFSANGCHQVPCQNYCLLLLLHAHRGTHIHFLLLQRQSVPTMSLVFLTFTILQNLYNMRGRREGFGNPAVS